MRTQPDPWRQQFPAGVLPNAVATAAAQSAAVAAVAVKAGQAVYVQQNGQLNLAEADIFATTNVAGLAVENIAAGFVAQVATQTLVLADWTASTGTSLLTPGRSYYLATAPGGLTLVPPIVPGQTVRLVGLAISSTQMQLNPSTTVLL